MKVQTLLEDMTRMKSGMRENEDKLRKVEGRIDDNTGNLVQVQSFTKEVETQMTETITKISQRATALHAESADLKRKTDKRKVKKSKSPTRKRRRVCLDLDLSDSGTDEDNKETPVPSLKIQLPPEQNRTYSAYSDISED